MWCLHERHRRGEFVQHFLLVFGQNVHIYSYSLSVCLYIIIVNQLPISRPIRDIYVRMLARKKLKLNTDTTEDLPSFYPSISPSSRSPGALALTPAKPGPSLSHTPSTKAGTNS